MDFVVLSPYREKKLLRRILIVDDEQAVLATLRDFFTELKLQVDCASGLEEARAKLSRNRYAAVLADIQRRRPRRATVLRQRGFSAGRRARAPRHRIGRAW